MSRPFSMRKRGDSGANQIRPICRTEGRPCKAEGTLHAHELSILKVPKVVHTATIALVYLIGTSGGHIQGYRHMPLPKRVIR